MDRQEYLYGMHNFVDSKEFKNKHIIKEDNKYYDPDTGIVYFVEINSVSEIESPPDVYDIDDKIVMPIYLSDKPRTIHAIGGGKFNIKNWNLKRINELDGFEFDYAYLTQIQSLHTEPFCNWSV